MIIAAAAKFPYRAGLTNVAKVKRPRYLVQDQLRHVKYGPEKPELTEVFDPKCPSHRNIQELILSLQTDSNVAEHGSPYLSLSYRQLCYRSLPNLAS